MPTPNPVDALSRVIEQRLVAGVLEVPILPAVATRVLAMLNEPDPDARELARLCARDPVLAAHIIRVANSPLMRAPGPVLDVQQAVARLGLRRVADIALAATLGPQLFEAPAYTAIIERCWSEALASACWAQELARVLQRHDDAAFLCGLLARIGTPVVLHAITAIAGARAPGPHDVDCLLARHQRLAGVRVGKAWSLPTSVSDCILWRTDHGAAAQPDLVAMIDVAIELAPLALDAESPVEPAALAESAALRACGVDAQCLETLLAARATVARLVQDLAQ